MKRFTKRRFIELLIGSLLILAGTVYFVGLDRIRQGWTDLTRGWPTKLELKDVDRGYIVHGPIGKTDLSTPDQLRPVIDLYNFLVEVMPNRQRTENPADVLPLEPDTDIGFSLGSTTMSPNRLWVFGVFGDGTPTVCVDYEYTFRTTPEDKKVIKDFLRRIDPKGREAGYYP